MPAKRPGYLFQALIAVSLLAFASASMAARAGSKSSSSKSSSSSAKKADQDEAKPASKGASINISSGSSSSGSSATGKQVVRHLRLAFLGVCDWSLSTARTIPRPTNTATIDEPPLEKSGNGTPRTGKRCRTTAMLMSA